MAKTQELRLAAAVAVARASADAEWAEIADTHETLQAEYLALYEQHRPAIDRMRELTNQLAELKKPLHEKRMILGALAEQHNALIGANA